jgi:hypothetical protein
MSTEERSVFLVPISVAGYLGAFLVLVGLDLFMLLYFKKRVVYGDLMFFIPFLLPLAGWFSFRFVQVNRSIRRYNARGETHSA